MGRNKKKNCVSCNVPITPLDGDFCCDNCRREYCNKKVEFTLLFPPSVNDYYGNRKGGGKYLKPHVKKYLDTMPLLIKSLCKNVKLKGKIKIDYLFATPDNRQHDIGNLYKALDDSIEKSGLIENDNDIYRGKTEKVTPGTVRLIVEEIN